MDSNWIAIIGVVLVWSAAIVIAVHPRSRRFAFASWVCASVATATLYPLAFIASMPMAYGSFLTLLLQIAMFGMGATLTVSDFARVVRMPWGVLVGLILQFSVMPSVGWAVSRICAMPPEIAMGLILVGTCPGGISSNVVTYLARGNVALSVTMTACSTMAAPIMTPMLFFFFAGESVDVDYLELFWQIVQTVVAPVLLGLLANMLLRRTRWKVMTIERSLAMVSMIAICLICGLIVAKSHERLSQIGLVLLLAVTVHNVVGFLFGYWGGKLLRLNEQDCRTIAIEVGMQNGGMAANLAAEILKKDAAALAPALFAAVMNVNGSILSSTWSKHRTAMDGKTQTNTPDGSSV